MKHSFLFLVLIIFFIPSCKTTYISSGVTLDRGDFAQSGDVDSGYGFNIDFGQGWSDEDLIIANFSFLGYSETGSDGTRLYFSALEYVKFRKMKHFSLMYGGGLGYHMTFPISLVIPARLGLFYEFPKNNRFHIGIVERPQFFWIDKNFNNGLTLTAGVKF